GAVVALAPPAVEDAQVQTTVTARLHAAGAGCLERAPRVVQPDIAAGKHLSCDVHVIVLDEHEVTLQVAVPGQVNDVLDESLPIIVPRMSLPGEDELNRPDFVAREPHDVLQLLKDERRAFVGGEPP